MENDNFKFDLNAKKVKATDEELLASLKEYANIVGSRYFSESEYNKWKNKKAHFSTISTRFGSWKKALKILGIIGGREFKYTPQELIDNLEAIWKQLGYPPGKRKISKLGLKISERPYKRIWGSVHAACIQISKYHEGKIKKEELLAGKSAYKMRQAIPLNIRYAVLKRDNFKCVKCGRSPSVNHKVELEVDHIKPVVRGGTSDIKNLQTLCKDCNQGKKDKE
jgi:hypothetical protein